MGMVVLISFGVVVVLVCCFVVVLFSLVGCLLWVRNFVMWCMIGLVLMI